MRRIISGTLTIVAGLVLVVVIAAGLVAAVAEGRPFTATTAACVGVPAPVSLQADRSGVRAGRVDVRCPRSWQAFQGIMWFSGSADQYGKWSYGGTRTVTGAGDTRIKPWSRGYYGCGWWKQRIIIGTESRDSQVEWLCSRR